VKKDFFQMLLLDFLNNPFLGVGFGGTMGFEEQLFYMVRGENNALSTFFE
jgi:hypothetical protein